MTEDQATQERPITEKPTPLVEEKGLPPVQNTRPMPPVKPPKKEED